MKHWLLLETKLKKDPVVNLKVHFNMWTQVKAYSNSVQIICENV